MRQPVAAIVWPADGHPVQWATDPAGLRDLAARAGGSHLVVSQYQLTKDEFSAILVDGLHHPDVMIFPLGEDSPVAADWSQFPPHVAVRIAPPEHRSVVALPLGEDRDSALFREVDLPVWDCLIRLVDAGCRVHIGAAASTPGVKEKLDAPRLVPGTRDDGRTWLADHLASTPLAHQNRVESVALRAGLFQMHDFLDASHGESQSIEGEGRHRNGDYWHGIMHRREPDYGNSKYWFRRVGAHPIFDSLQQQAETVLADCPSPQAVHWRDRLMPGGRWDPFAFVDLCESCAGDEDSELGRAARAIQWQEMRLLLRQTCRDGGGTG